MLALAAGTATPAQDDPPQPEAEAEGELLLLTPEEVAMWQAWIRGDMKGCYTAAQNVLDSGSSSIALELQARAADELGWHGAHARDLDAFIETCGDRVRPFAKWKLGERLTQLGDVQRVRQIRDELGFINHWWVLGPFTNDRGQGFDDVLEPERGFSIDAEFSGKEGQAVILRQLPVDTLDGTVDLAALHQPNEAAAAYLVTAIWCDEQQKDAQFLFGSSCPVKMALLAPARAELEEGSRFRWFGDRDRERVIGFDQDGFNIGRSSSEPNIKYDEGLQAGWNVVLLKCGVDEGDWKVRVRLSGVENCRFAADDEELSEALVAEPAHTEGTWGGRGGFAYRRDTDGIHGARYPFLDAVEELLLPELDRTSSLPRRKMQEALDEFDELPVGDDIHAILSYVAAWANRSTARYSAGREENRRRELLKQCLELDPKAARAAYELSQYYTTTFGNPDLADKYAKAAVEANPDWIAARIYASRVVAMKGLDMEVERELAALLQEHPDNASVLRFSGYYAGLRRDYKLSNDLFAKALKADFADPYSRARLLERAVARGDTAEALRQAADTRKLDPFDTSAAHQLADLFMHDEKYSLAEREINRALKIAPRDDELLEKLGQVYSGWADASGGEKAVELRAKSLEAYNAALDANPGREDIERYLEYLEGEQPPFEAALQEDITDRIRQTLETEVSGDNPYEVVYRDKIVVVNEDGTTSQYIQEALRVTNDNGRDWLQRLPVPAWSDQRGRCVEARVWRADGEIEEGRRSRWSAAFPPLDIGDIVHVRFRVTDTEQSFFGDFYGAREVFMDYVPVHEVRYAWVLASGRKFYDYRTGAAPNRQISSVDGRTVWQFRATDLPKLYDEPLAPAPHMLSPTVQISTYENWKDFGRWYYNLIRKQMEATPEMTAKVNELIADAETEKDKARAVYNWVVTQVRYNADWHFGVHGYKPFSAGAVFARCIGDCKDKAILICTMLGIAGVKAYPVIINLENFRGEEDITLPMPNHFNHAIAYIEFSDGEGLFVDGTTTYNGINELSSADRGANVIIVRPDGGERTQIPWGTAESDSRSDEMDAEFAGNGTLKLKVKRSAVGDSASLIRMRYQREGDRKKALEREWAEFFPGAKVSEITTSDLSDLDATPTISFTVELPNAYTIKEGSIEFQAGLDPREWTQTEFAALTTRRTALLTPAPYQRVSVTRFKLPEGYASAKLPKALNIKHPNVRLNVSADVNDGVLTITREYALLGGTILPEAYPDFRRKLIEFDSAEATTIRLKK